MAVLAARRTSARWAWFESFSADETLRRAFVRSLKIIGETTKKVPEDFRATHPAAEWRAMAGETS